MNIQNTVYQGKEVFIEGQSDNFDVELEKYKGEIKALTAKCEQLKQDFKNYRTRMNRNETIKEQKMKQSMVRELLPEIDVLDRARNFDLDKKRAKAINKILVNIRKNLTMTYNKMISTLGLQLIDPSPGDMFDDERHIALKIINSDTFFNNTIVTAIRKGYSLDGKVLRPAEVVLSRYTGKKGAKTKRDSLIHRIAYRIRSFFPIKD